jgi:hypothetical protein
MQYLYHGYGNNYKTSFFEYFPSLLLSFIVIFGFGLRKNKFSKLFLLFNLFLMLSIYFLAFVNLIPEAIIPR